MRFQDEVPVAGLRAIGKTPERDESIPGQLSDSDPSLLPIPVRKDQEGQPTLGLTTVSTRRRPDAF